jgi:hypothetical protein
MKKILLLSVVLIAIAAFTISTIPAPPPLYPELEAYFKSVETKDFGKDHHEALENIKYNVTTSNTDYEDWNLIFYCSENIFRSQASQVFAQTLCYAKRYKKVKVYSAGYTSGDISPKLIAYLIKIGYKITKNQKEGKPVYEVRFSDKAAPIVLFSKTTSDQSLPKKDITSIIVCDVKNESDCATLKTETTPFNLAFSKVIETDPDEKIEATLKGIASEMVYVTQK